MASVETSNVDKIKKPKTRSPNYPSLGLEKAAEMTAGIYNEYKTHPIPVLLLHKKWGYKEGSGIANQAVAALKAYGLVDVSGVADDRKVTVSKTGQRIVGNAPDRAELLRKAALGPKIHREVLDHYEEKGLPVDELLRQYLVWGRPDGQRFNPETVNEFIERFRATLTYAGVSSIDKMEGEDGSEDEPEDEDVEKEWGERVAAEKARRERRDREKRQMPPGTKEDVFTLESGPVVFQWPGRLTAEEYEDLEGWMTLVLRKAKRSIVVDDEEDDEPDDAED